VVDIAVGATSADFEVVLILSAVDQVDGDGLDDGHVLLTVDGSQAGKVIMEDHIEHPVETVLDAPMTANRVGRLFGAESLPRYWLTGLARLDSPEFAKTSGDLRCRGARPIVRKMM
jgi:hypothetical protein